MERLSANLGGRSYDYRHDSYEGLREAVRRLVDLELESAVSPDGSVTLTRQDLAGAVMHLVDTPEPSEETRGSARLLAVKIMGRLEGPEDTDEALPIDKETVRLLIADATEDQ